MASALNHPHIVTVYDVGEFERAPILGYRNSWTEAPSQTGRTEPGPAR